MLYKSWNGFRLFYTIVRLFFAAFVKIRFFNENWCNEQADKRFEGQRIIKDKSSFNPYRSGGGHIDPPL